MSASDTDERQVTQAQLDRLAGWSMRKPVIALMGEFSAGKSTLLNLLIGQKVLPTQITATRMPPVWLRYGDAAPYRVDREGNRYPVDLDDRDAIPVDETAYIRLFCHAEILKSCDLMDTPGISDPNIRADDWIRTVRYANAVMWCTHAGQAWRESERGAWEALPSRLRQTSILLVTRKDKITSELNLRKISRRLDRETSHLFNARMFISLTNALRARAAEDDAAWTESGAEAFSDMLAQIVEGVAVQRSFMMARYVLDGQGARAVQAPAEVASDPETDESHTSNPLPALSDEAHAGEAADPVELHDPSNDAPLIEQPAPLYGFRSYRSGAELDSYRLKAPAEPEAAARPRLDLANYRLKVPSELPAASDEGEIEGETVSHRSDTNTTEFHAQSRDFKSTELTNSPIPVNEVDKIREIWKMVREQHDVTETPSLVAAFESLISEKGGDGQLVARHPM